ncbi:uncharacterized protein N7482_005526 [Penicillium canariense]|uniref:Uncharacterized protein n=1 Tax=Penicillium canariense TaxID=189055 RepID=A0A9W9I519_9EURO|nr:uncharacterized protein N7482_005526 [Penicillium canariense]KAJ5166745.1 hypothetical protein N7482_005526 [Penicillium canariense]
MYHAIDIITGTVPWQDKLQVRGNYWELLHTGPPLGQSGNGKEPILQGSYNGPTPWVIALALSLATGHLALLQLRSGRGRSTPLCTRRGGPNPIQQAENFAAHFIPLTAWPRALELVHANLTRVFR